MQHLRTVIKLKNLLVYMWLAASGTWSFHTDTATSNFHCWRTADLQLLVDPDHLECSAVEAGISASWVKSPARKLQVNVPFDVSMKLQISNIFWNWSVSNAQLFSGQSIQSGEAARIYCLENSCSSPTLDNMTCCINTTQLFTCRPGNEPCLPHQIMQTQLATDQNQLVDEQVVNTITLDIEWRWQWSVEAFNSSGLLYTYARVQMDKLDIWLFHNTSVFIPGCGDDLCDTSSEDCKSCSADCGGCGLSTAAFSGIFCCSVLILSSILLLLPVVLQKREYKDL